MSTNGLEKPEKQNLIENLSREQTSQAASNADALQAIAQAAALLSAALSAMAGATAGPSATNGAAGRSNVVRFPLFDQSYTLGEAVKDFLNAKARAGRSDRYLQALRVSLKSFALGRYQVPLSQITIADLERWLDKSQWSPRTQRGYLSDVRVLFNFAIKRGLARDNPANAVELPVLENTLVEIHTPEQAAAVLAFARQQDINLCRCLAVRYFAGLRSSEATRLAESEIKPGFIEVTARKSKTRRRRLVKIEPCLAAWLALGGELPLRDFNNRYRWFTAALKTEKGITWPHNVTRHSFVSYHLAQFQNAGKTALEAGHTEQMVFAHYREVVTAASAAAYWNILPL